MRRTKSFPVLVATDGSAPARAALAAAATFPWPSGARLHVVLARAGFVGTWVAGRVREAMDQALERLAQATRHALARRGLDADVAVLDRPALDAILARARAVGARAIVVGSRGHGALGRFLLGSVSRGVVRHARCPVLVVKGRPRQMRRVVVGLDGSANSRRAIAFVAALRRPSGGRVTLVAVVEPVRVPTAGLLPAAVRAAVSGQAAALTRERVRAARRETASTAGRLARAGWAVRSLVRLGLPAPELLSATRAARADVLVVGARGVGGVERLLLGSVAEAAVTRSPVSVLIVR